MKSKSTANLSLLLACLFWGISFSASKTAVQNGIPPLTIVFLRLFISSLCFLAWILILRIKLDFKWNLKWFLTVFVLSLFGTGLHYSTQTIGIDFTTASNASVFPATGPILILIISAIFLREKINFQKITGIFLSLVGIILVIGLEVFTGFQLEGHLLGDFLVFLSILMWAIFTVVGKNFLTKSDPLKMTAIITFIGTIYMIIPSIMEISSKKNFSLNTIPFKAWGSVVFLGVTCSFLATLLYVFALKDIGSHIAGIYLYTIPPIGYIYAVIFLGDPLSWQKILGILLVIGGVYFTQSKIIDPNRKLSPGP